MGIARKRGNQPVILRSEATKNLSWLAYRSAGLL